MQPVAVIGISTLFPEAATPKEFWENLLAGKDSRFEATEEQLGIEPARFFDPQKGSVDRYYCLKGGYIRDFIPDPEDFAIDPEHLGQLDNVCRWTIHVARESLRDGGYRPATGRLLL